MAGLLKIMKITLMAMLVLTLLSGCGKVSEWNEQSREREEQHCQINWGDSGYEHRVISFKQDADTELLSHRCQVKVSGRWVPEESVKITSGDI